MKLQPPNAFTPKSVIPELKTALTQLLLHPFWSTQLTAPQKINPKEEDSYTEKCVSPKDEGGFLGKKGQDTELRDCLSCPFLRLR